MCTLIVCIISRKETGYRNKKYPDNYTVLFITHWKLLAYSINDTHREKLVWIEFSTKIRWNTRLAASDVFHMFTQSIKVTLLLLSYKCLKNVIHQVDSENAWLLLSVNFTAKLELVFALTFENASS